MAKATTRARTSAPAKKRSARTDASSKAKPLAKETRKKAPASTGESKTPAKKPAARKAANSTRKMAVPTGAGISEDVRSSKSASKNAEVGDGNAAILPNTGSDVLNSRTAVDFGLAENRDAGAKQTGPVPGSASEVLGEVTALLIDSRAHRHLLIQDMEWRFLPPIMRKQFRLYRTTTEEGRTRPYAVATWAMVSETVAARLNSLNGGDFRLAPAEWASGDIPYVIDVVSPFGDGGALIAELRKFVFDDEKIEVFR